VFSIKRSSALEIVSDRDEYFRYASTSLRDLSNLRIKGRLR
jgi:hypothetical protein